MADITLSKAVRSNLLNLQSTATLMGKTQERLATGLKVNSALDNPTNFFTASSLNSRAGDLSQLLDSVSNAVQTLSAADKGISAITKLVETAQATARQALQTAATVEQTTVTGGSDATSASVSAGAFSTVDVSNAGSAAQDGVISGTGFTAVDVSQEFEAATSATHEFGAFSTVDVSNGADAITFDISVDGDPAVTVTISDATVTQYNNDHGAGLDSENLSAADIAAMINDQVGASIASVDGDSGNLVFTSTTDGTGSTIEVTDFASGVTGGDSGLGNINVAGDDQIDAAEISFTLNVNGTSETITINAATVDAFDNSLDAGNLSAQNIADIINDQFGSTVATVDNDELVITGAASGDDGGSVAITGYTASTTADGATGLGDASNSGADAVAADSISFTLSVDGNDTSISITAATVAAFDNTLDADSLSAQNIADIINSQAGATVASVDGDTGNLVFTSATTGTGSTVEISDYSASVSGGSTGIADASDQGDAAVAGTPTTSQVANPKRDELRDQYNELLSQIDGLAKDAGFNGVNLLQGDTLKVLFNEDGSSSIDITGTSFDSLGLGLGSIASGGFDENDDINAVLADLKSGIETLRTQASKFGSNLSVVETRQDFTKNMINVLQTGAADLTLADTNEEAANLLALQTRQQLSSTALSLASQADQQVLRLF